jgi:hypothetical protein
MTAEQITLSVAQARKWTHPANWMINGYSSTQEIYYINSYAQNLTLAAGGWTLNAADLLRLHWSGRPDKESIYWIQYNERRLYQGLWQPQVNHTVTESFFYDGDLYVLNYRLLAWTAGSDTPCQKPYPGHSPFIVDKISCTRESGHSGPHETWYGGTRCTWDGPVELATS